MGGGKGGRGTDDGAGWGTEFSLTAQPEGVSPFLSLGPTGKEFDWRVTFI